MWMARWAAAATARRSWRRLNGTGHLYGIDRDNDALAAATERLVAAGNFTAVKGNFHDVKALLAAAA